MVAQTTNGGIEHWLLEEMKVWHSLPLFIALALAGWAILAAAGQFVTVPLTVTEWIAASGLFAGLALGWTARRQYEDGRFTS